MNKILLLLIVAITQIHLTAQTRRSYTVEPGQKIAEAIPVTALYSSPEFTLGTVQLRDGSEATVKLNYNSVYGEIQYIDPKTGDTLSLAEEKNIRFVAIQKDTFYFDEGWMQFISGNPTLKLAKKRLLEKTNNQKLGPMDSPGFGAIETYNKYTGSQQARNLVAKERITFTEHITYYFGDRFNHFSKASKKMVLKTYDDNQKELGKWIEENKIDFNKEEDLQKLFDHLQTL